MTRPAHLDWNLARQIVFELTGQASKAKIERVVLLMKRAREKEKGGRKVRAR